MSKSGLLLYIVLLVLALLMTIVGAVSLWRDGSSIWAFILFGVGLGGLIAGLGEVISDIFPDRKDK